MIQVGYYRPEMLRPCVFDSFYFMCAKITISIQLQTIFCPFNLAAVIKETNDEEFDTIAFSQFYFYL